MKSITIDITEDEYDGLVRECRRQEIEDGVEHISIEEQAASAVRFLLMELHDMRKEA
jgi:hypothetical protein